MSLQLFLTIFLHCSLSCDAVFQSVTPSFLKSVVTASSHFFFGLTLFLPPVGFSLHISGMASYRHDPGTLFFVPLYRVIQFGIRDPTSFLF
jgi:hypothetical protein